MEKTLHQVRDEIEGETKKFLQDSLMQVDKSNKAAGARSRKSTLALAKMFKEWRKLSVEAAASK